MNKSKVKKVTIPADIMAELDAIPQKNQTPKQKTFTPEQDAILLYMFENKSHIATIRWWRNKYGWGSKESLGRRHKELAEAK